MKPMLQNHRTLKYDWSEYVGSDNVGRLLPWNGDLSCDDHDQHEDGNHESSESEARLYVSFDEKILSRSTLSNVRHVA